MKRFFHSELASFRSNIVLMGEKSIELVRLAMRALLEQNPTLAESVLLQDNDIDQLEVTIDSEAIRYMSLRSPVASELRLLTVGMKVGHDLERVGDEATSIARRARRLATVHPALPTLDLPRMADLALEMLRESIDCFLEGDEERAKVILIQDKRVDAINRDIFLQLTEILPLQSDRVHALLDLMFVSKSLERIADHATNIAEEVIYLTRGQDVRHSAEVKELKKSPLPGA